MATQDELWERAAAYAAREGATIIGYLGGGYDGSVFATDRQSAIKCLKYPELYQRERDVYLRLADLGIRELRGFNIPRLLASDEDLLILEISIVQPPFALDFAGTYLDQRPDFPPDVMRRWEAEKREQFGSRWPEVRTLMAAFARHGIYLADVKPGNVSFAEEE